jgi:transposase
MSAIANPIEIVSPIKWRAMPHDLLKWSSVYTYFRAECGLIKITIDRGHILIADRLN